MNRSFIYSVLFLICVLSRLISSINYFEDYQSLLISIAVKNNDILYSFKNFQYPLFIVIIKVFYFLTNNLYLAFSIVGGISVFLIIYFTLRLLKTPLASLEGGLITFLIFFNPLLWIASNRFTPELAGSALTITCFFLLFGSHENKYLLIAGGFLTGILGGIYFNYEPFLILPFLYAFIKKRSQIFTFLSLAIGIAVWLIPTIQCGGHNFLIQHFENLVFINSNIHYGERLIQVVRDLWTGGLGGFWNERIWITIIISLGILPLLLFGSMIILSFEYNKIKMLLFLLSLISLLIVTINSETFNNSSLSIFIPFLMVIISYGIIYFLVNFNTITVKALILIFLVAQVAEGIYFAIDHKEPTSSEQLRQYLFEKKRDVPIQVSSDELKNYLILQGINSKLIQNKQLKKSGMRTFFVYSKDTTLSVFAKTVHFHHNFVRNSKWPYLVLYEY